MNVHGECWWRAARLFGRGVSACVLVAVGAAAVSLVMAAAPAPAAAFNDVPATHQYYQAIQELHLRGIVSGRDDGSFGPDANVFRRHFAKMIVGTLALPTNPEAAIPFADVDPDDVSKFIVAAAANQITKGVDDAGTLFAPYEGVKRAQVVTMMVRALQQLEPQVLTQPAALPGTLGDFAPEHGPNLRLAEANGLLVGLQGFGPAWDPWQIATRGEVAQMLYNLLLKLTPPVEPPAIQPGVYTYDVSLALTGSLHRLRPGHSVYHPPVTPSTMRVRVDVTTVTDQTVTFSLLVQSASLAGEVTPVDRLPGAVTVVMKFDGEIVSVTGAPMDNLPDQTVEQLRTMVSAVCKAVSAPFRQLAAGDPGASLEWEGQIDQPDYFGATIPADWWVEFASADEVDGQTLEVFNYTANVAPDTDFTIDFLPFARLFIGVGDLQADELILTGHVKGTLGVAGQIQIDRTTGMLESSTTTGNLDVDFTKLTFPDPTPQQVLNLFDADQEDFKSLKNDTVEVVIGATLDVDQVH